MRHDRTASGCGVSRPIVTSRRAGAESAARSEPGQAVRRGTRKPNIVNQQAQGRDRQVPGNGGRQGCREAARREEVTVQSVLSARRATVFGNGLPLSRCATRGRGFAVSTGG